jgi:hypothetical protein
LNVESSDLDLGIGYPVQRRKSLTAALATHSSIKGERVTRFPTAERAGDGSGTTTRLVFAFTVDRVTEYAEWKLVTYARFCPEFTWVPIPEPA